MRASLGAILFAAGLACGLLSGQTPAATAVQVEGMKKLNFLLGRWKGEGWNEFMPGRHTAFAITENIQSKLGGLAVLIEGSSKSRKPETGEEVQIHEALAVATYDDRAKVHRWKAYSVAGPPQARVMHTVETEAKVDEGFLEWGFQIPNMGKTRYTIKLTETGRWYEVGEITQDDGKTWRKFHEMTLERMK